MLTLVTPVVGPDGEFKLRSILKTSKFKAQQEEGKSAAGMSLTTVCTQRTPSTAGTRQETLSEEWNATS